MKNPINIKILALGDGLQPGHYDLYARFKNVDNYLNSQGNLIAISDNYTLLAANAIIINRFGSGLYMNVELFDRQILINDTNIATEEAVTYNSSFDFNNTTHDEAVQIAYNFINQNTKYFPDESLLTLLTGIPKSVIQAFPIKTSKTDEAMWTNFKRAISVFEDDFFGSVRMFKGKGYGLTPSGDDFIAGVLYGIHFLEKIEGIEHQKVKQKVFKIASGKNLFSNNMLNMALNAQYFIRLKDFLSALFYPELSETKESFQQLVSTGHTSGADLLAGFFSVILHRPSIFARKSG